MPRPALPPTPASSTDIKGQDGTTNLASLQMSFELPPPAIVQDGSTTNSPTDTNLVPGNYKTTSPTKASFPLQPSETVKSRRRTSSTAQTLAKETFALPPPPTRSRKIIQMKPRSQEEVVDAPTGAKSATSTKAAASGSSTTPAKRKQPSATSAAGRKIARKTAHSLIERRRRSKMNEEFAVLKGMIPACTGEMHKLAILQASIEYVRYLEDCVTKLKAQRGATSAQTPTESGAQTPSARDEWAGNPPFVPSYREDDGADVDMTGSEAPSPTFNASHSRSQQPSISPALLAQDSQHRHNSYSSASTDQRHYSYSASSTTSPAFGPAQFGVGGGTLSASASTLTSPALAPLRDLDQEATAALLMLNSDRRGAANSSSSGTGRGMSVRDLLST